MKPLTSKLQTNKLPMIFQIHISMIQLTVWASSLVID